VLALPTSTPSPVPTATPARPAKPRPPQPSPPRRQPLLLPQPHLDLQAQTRLPPLRPLLPLRRVSPPAHLCSSTP
jgi:hypothetical protein